MSTRDVTNAYQGEYITYSSVKHPQSSTTNAAQRDRISELNNCVMNVE